MDRKDKKTNQVDRICNSKYFKELENEIISEKNSILIIFGRYPVYVNKEYLVPRNGDLSWEFLTYPGEKSQDHLRQILKIIIENSEQWQQNCSSLSSSRNENKC